MTVIRICSAAGRREQHFNVRWLAAALLALVALACLVGRPATASASEIIQSISVSGNRRLEAETVRTYLRFNVGDVYDPAKVDQSLRALFATGLFKDVNIERKGNSVVVAVVENPIISKVAFEGNHEVDKATLESEVQLKPRTVYTRAKAQANVQRILDIYRRFGRYSTTVEPKIIELEDGRINIVFEIKESGAVKIKSIQFAGNRYFSETQLRDVITTTQQSWFDFLKGTAYYDPDRLNLDREMLRQFYLKNGFADVRILSADAHLDRDDSGFFITFVIEEGEPYTFGEIRIDGKLPGTSTEKLNRHVLTQQGATFNAAEIDKTVEPMTLDLIKQGSTFARVRPRADRDGIGRVVALTYVIDEGPRVYIERINIIGNERTRDHVIRREFPLAEGDAYNRLLVDNAKKRLTNLGLFKNVDIKQKPGSAPDRIVLDVVVTEQPTGEISFGGGYSTADGIIGDIGLTERNFMGKGQLARIRFMGSLEGTAQIELSFTEPRFLERNLSAGFDIFHRITDVTTTQPYATRNSGATLRLGIPLTEQLWLNTSYTLSNNEIDEVAEGASRAIQEAQGQYWTSSLGANFTYDARNSPKTPTKGFYFQIGADLAGLGGDVRYVRANLDARYYYPISERITFVGRAAGGHIAGWGGEDVRMLDLYYKGGENIRGFDTNGLGPRDTLTGDALGGDTFWTVTAEVRFPLPIVPDEIGLSGAVFADAGSLFSAGPGAQSLNALCGAPGTTNPTTGVTTYPGVCLADSSAIRASVGIGLLWNSPLGPLRLDFAKAIRSESYDEEQIFRFGGSTRF